MSPITNIYADGSGCEQAIGAAAVLLDENEMEVEKLQFRLGREHQHTVYEAEVTGLLLALQLINLHNINGPTRIWVDNKAAIQALTLRRPAPSHYLVDEFHRMHQALVKDPALDHLTIDIIWIKGHAGIVGNEMADEAAKAAAQGTASTRERLPPILWTALPLSKSATLQAFRTRIKARIVSDFAKSPRFARSYELDPSVPFSPFRKIAENLNRKTTSLLAQLRIGHVPLQAYLHRFKRAESPTCLSCNEAPETVIHYFLRCPAFAKQRRILENAFDTKARSLRTLLSDEDSLGPVFQYINATRRFHSIYGYLEHKSREVGSQEHHTTGKRRRRKATKSWYREEEEQRPTNDPVEPYLSEAAKEFTGKTCAHSHLTRRHRRTAHADSPNGSTGTIGTRGPTPHSQKI